MGVQTDKNQLLDTDNVVFYKNIFPSYKKVDVHRVVDETVGQDTYRYIEFKSHHVAERFVSDFDGKWRFLPNCS